MKLARSDFVGAHSFRYLRIRQFLSGAEGRVCRYNRIESHPGFDLDFAGWTPYTPTRKQPLREETAWVEEGKTMIQG
ncbi:hypothetical protein KIW74_gp22 [Mycobacterium phage Kimona]|uniref:Uncharacterized protein n=1 Tax=Mycobacterium phage Kimona TaxID=2024295 RepID=A0A249XVH6_9CAUD|nr:hypothetical protein KIW74_gp22 [Mycobacterium phage Kimona]ASZ75506.1 hypothetical protein PBI_KIMONA_70 [Mycobacterium phage Kimona]